MLSIKTLSTTLLQIVFKMLLSSEVIFKSMTGPDDICRGRNGFRLDLFRVFITALLETPYLSGVTCNILKENHDVNFSLAYQISGYKVKYDMQCEKRIDGHWVID